MIINNDNADDDALMNPLRLLFAGVCIAIPPPYRTFPCAALGVFLRVSTCSYLRT